MDNIKDGIHRFISAISSNSSEIQMLTLGDFVYPIEALYGIRAPNLDEGYSRNMCSLS